MSWPISNKWVIITAAAMLYIIAVMVNLGYAELDGEEPRRALISIEMLHSGNYISPSLLGWEYFNKPPVYNWILCCFIFITGSSAEWAVRLPSLVFVLVWGFAHYKIAKQFLPKTVAALSAIFFLTCGEIFFYGLQNGGEIDIFYGFITYLQVVLIFFFYEKRKWLMLYGFSYLFCAVGFLTKGFPSIAFQAFTLIALMIYAKSVKVIFKWQHLAGLFVFFIMAGGYLYAYSFYNSPARLLINLLNESIRKTALDEAAGGLRNKIIDYPVRMFSGLLPWSFFILFLKRNIRYSFFTNPLLKFSILFILCNIWIYWFAGMLKLRYSYVFFPFLCMLLAFIYYRFSNENTLWAKKLFNYLGHVFWIVPVSLIALSFFHYIPAASLVITCFFLVAFAVVYFKSPGNRVWLFITGFIFLRFVYAFLLLPLADNRRQSIKYRPYIQHLAAINQSAPLTFYAKPDTFTFKADLKFKKWELEKILAPPEIFKQAPYYYYQATGHIAKYDTAIRPGQSYFTYSSVSGNKNIKKLWSFYDDRMKADFIFFKGR